MLRVTNVRYVTRYTHFFTEHFSDFLQPSTLTIMEITYWGNPDKNLMYKRLSPTVLILLQVLGRDLLKVFSHRHELITYPTAERLEADLAEMKQRTHQDWEDLTNEYLQVNKSKLQIMSDHRQRMFEKGGLAL